MNFVSIHFDAIWKTYQNVVLKGSYYLSELEIELAAILYDKKNVRVVEIVENRKDVVPSQPDPFNFEEGAPVHLIYHAGVHYSQCAPI